MYPNAFLNIRKLRGCRPIKKAVFVRLFDPSEKYFREVIFIEKKYEEKWKTSSQRDPRSGGDNQIHWEIRVLSLFLSFCSDVERRNKLKASLAFHLFMQDYLLKVSPGYAIKIMSIKIGVR